MAESGSASLSSQQLVDFIAGFVSDRFSQSGRGVSGAVIADAVRKEFPNDDIRNDFGERWLATLTTDAEHAGKVVRNHSVKHLELFPPGKQSRPSSPSGTSTRLYVKDDVWKAFVFLPQTRAAFFDRLRNRVVTSCDDDESGTDRYVEIKAIAADEQKEWFRQFVSSSDELTPSDAPLDDEFWWRACPAWLRDHNPSLEYQWRGFRADCVTRHIRQWADGHGIDSAAILAPATKTPASSSHKPSHSGSHRPDDRTREAILSAIRDMPIEELENLSIPLRYVLRHFDVR